jgi:hypothetical protein
MAKLHNEAFQIFARGLNIPPENYAPFGNLVQSVDLLGRALADHDKSAPKHSQSYERLAYNVEQVHDRLLSFAKANNIMR